MSDWGTRERKDERLNASKRQRRLSLRLAFSTHQELGGACQGKGSLRSTGSSAITLVGEVRDIWTNNYRVRDGQGPDTQHAHQGESVEESNGPQGLDWGLNSHLHCNAGEAQGGKTWESQGRHQEAGRILAAQEGAGSRFLSLGKVYLIKVGTEILGTQHLSNRKQKSLLSWGFRNGELDWGRIAWALFLAGCTLGASSFGEVGGYKYLMALSWEHCVPNKWPGTTKQALVRQGLSSQVVTRCGNWWVLKKIFVCNVDPPPTPSKRCGKMRLHR